MGNVGDQLRFHTLAFDFLLHCLFKALVHHGKLFFKWFKHAHICFHVHLQISFCHFAGSFHQHTVVFFHLFHIPAEQEKQYHRIHKECKNSYIKNDTAKEQYHKVDCCNPKQPLI